MSTDFKSFDIVGSGVDSRALQDMLSAGHKDPMDIPYKTPDENTITSADGTIYELNSLGAVQYASAPTVVGQFKKQNMWKLGSTHAKVFHLKEEEDMKEYNNLLAKASSDDPSIIIAGEDRKFYNGNFVVFAVYRPVMYKTLIKKRQ